MNSIMSIFNGSGNMMMKAFGAMMRGESPQMFLQNLAATNPALQGLDLTNINATAEQLCRERGIDSGKLTAEIQQSVSKMK